jgi:Recombination endonuclease VII
MAAKRCKDCKSLTRPANRPGPRCVTCSRVFRGQQREAAWAKRLWDTYHITPEQYWAIYELQGGKCALCARATGRTKKLAVDHDHKCCPGPISCGACVRGLCCGPCNKGVLGHLRDSVEALQRAIKYLIDPPARRVLS